MISHYLQRHGIPTTTISLIREHTEMVRQPRALWVPFPLGRPLGAANHPDFQRDVLRSALSLLESATEPTIADYPHDAPDMEDGLWACSIALPQPDVSDLESALRAEVDLLTPYYEEARRRRGRTTVGISGAKPEEIEQVVSFILAIAEGNGFTEIPATAEGPAVDQPAADAGALCGRGLARLLSGGGDLAGGRGSADAARHAQLDLRADRAGTSHHPNRPPDRRRSRQTSDDDPRSDDPRRLLEGRSQLGRAARGRRPPRLHQGHPVLPGRRVGLAMTLVAESDPLLSALSEFYGYDSFRPSQREVIEHVLAGGDSLVLMPTGGGKSLCYQLPSILSDGLTVVVSPLIALMHDQVDALIDAGVPAAFLNSTLSPMEMADVERLVESGSVKLLYVAPERVNTDSFRRLMERRNPSLIAIDEAHCISEWGHEFRPDYRVLQRFTERFVDVPTVACTATATPQVQRDIIEQLDRPRMQTFSTGFMRENLTLRIVPKRKAVERLAARLAEMSVGAAIVYSTSRKSTEDTAAGLRQRGIEAEHYHAGMATGERTAVQNRFAKGRTPVICATIAFGMGIDKPDIRLVAHLDMPPSIESYYQQVGRAGRDGEASECLMFYTKGVWHQQKFFIDQITDAEEREQRVKRLRTMMNFSEQPGCRWSRILNYFGDPNPVSECGHCDRCLGEDDSPESGRAVDRDNPPAAPGGPASPMVSEADQPLYEALRQERMRLASSGRGLGLHRGEQP